MKCPGCGAMNVDAAVECSMCGRELPPSVSKGHEPVPQHIAEMTERIERAPHYKPSRMPYLIGGIALIALAGMVLWLRGSPKGLPGTWKGQYESASATLTINPDGACRLQANGQPACEGKWRSDGKKLSLAWSDGSAKQEWWYKVSADGTSLKLAPHSAGSPGKASKQDDPGPPKADSSEWQTWQRVTGK